MQKSNIKTQNEKEKFKENFVKRLVSFSMAILAFAEKLRIQPTLRPVADQLIRSATSIGANVVEAKSSSSRKDYLHFFEIALKSSNETKYWLILIQESQPTHQKDAVRLYNEAEELSKIGSSVLTLKGRR